MSGYTEAALAVLVTIAGIYDLRCRRIPNWLVLCGLAAGLVLNPWQTSLGGVGVALLIYLPFYLLRGMGAGDVKLMMAVGSLCGPRDWLAVFVITSLLGGVIAVCMILWRNRVLETMGNLGFIFTRLVRLRAPYTEKEELDVRSSKGMRLPHGTVIATGALLYLVYLRLTV